MKVDKAQGDFIYLLSGERFYLDANGVPVKGRSPVNIDDIAIGVATKCRFNGQLGLFYSVAQHSYIMSRICPEGWELEGLLHDAEEVYWCDAPRPWKILFPMLDGPGQRISKHINAAYTLKPLDDHMKSLDTRLGHTEAWFLGHEPDWVRESYILDEARPYLVRAWEWREARAFFIQRFLELWGARTL